MEACTMHVASSYAMYVQFSGELKKWLYSCS